MLDWYFKIGGKSIFESGKISMQHDFENGSLICTKNI
jgi:hypothetical protein